MQDRPQLVVGETTGPLVERLAVAPFGAVAGEQAGQGLGRVNETYTARVRPELPGAQDGGVVSALLIALLEAGDLDGALLARESPTEPWKGEPFLARTPAEV